MRFLAPITLYLIAFLAGQNALAQSELREGLVKSQAIQPMPPGFSMDVVVYDDTDLNLEIKAALEDALKSNGRLVIEGPAALDFEMVSDVVVVQIMGVVPYLGRAGTEDDVDGVSARINVFSTQQNSLFGGEGVTVQGYQETSFHINGQIRDSETGRVLWHGDVYAYMPSGDPRTVMQAMVENLAAVVGETTSPRRFSAY